MIVQLGLFTSIHLVIWADVLLVAWLGPAYADAIPLMRVIGSAMPAYLGYVVLNSVINATETRPITTVTVLASLGVAAGISLGLGATGFGALGLAAGTSAGLFLVGAASIAFLWWRHRFKWTALVRTCLANLALGAVAWGAHAMVREPGSLSSLIVAGSIELVLIGTYGFCLWRWRMSWIQQIASRMHLQRGVQP
jgi:hypothetical protein